MTKGSTSVNSPEGIIVVGAGPVGLTFAANMVRHGRAVTVLESAPELSTAWRASTFHPPTLEKLEALGIVDAMIERGLVGDKYQIRDRRHGLVAEFDLRELADETAYPYRLQLEQYKYSQLLLEKVTASPLFTLCRGETVADVSEEGDQVVVTSTAADGVERQRRARFVVGADGARSAVRRALGLELEGHTYPVRFLILSTDYPFEERFPDLALVNYVWDASEPVMLLRTRDVWRVMFSAPDGLDETDLIDPASIQRRLRRLIGDSAPEQVPVSAAQYYSVHQRVASTFRVGRVLLAGDAGHINSPVGGLGLNSGIHDALELSDVIAGVLSGTEDDLALDRVADRRRQVALDTVRTVTDRNTRQMIETDDDVRDTNIRAMRELAADATRRREWLLESSMLRSVRDLAKDG